MSTKTNQLGIDCDSCEFTLTVHDIVEEYEQTWGRRPRAEYVNSKFGSLAEGHAYFNRGHFVSHSPSIDDIRAVLER